MSLDTCSGVRSSLGKREYLLAKIISDLWSQAAMSERVDCNASLSIVLVNFRSLEMTSICLDLIQQGINVSEVPVWVVDNDSKRILVC